MLPSGEFFVFWTEERSRVSIYYFFENRRVLDKDVVGQRFSAAGVAIGAPFRVHETTEGREERVKAILQGGGVLVTWQDAGNLFARRFKRSGEPVGATVRINGASQIGNQSLAANAPGDYAIAWESTGDGDQQGVFARWFDKTGAPSGGEVLVNTETVGRQRRPSVASDKAGNFLIVWQTGDLEHIRIAGQMFDADGDRAGGQFLVNQGGPNDFQIAPSAVALPNGNFLVLWLDWTETVAKGVWGVEINGDGLPVSGEVQLSVGPIYPQWRTSMATNGLGRTLAVWEGLINRQSSVAARFLNVR
jgi:hypothetical protein